MEIFKNIRRKIIRNRYLITYDNGFFIIENTIILGIDFSYRYIGVDFKEIPFENVCKLFDFADENNIKLNI